MCTGALSGYLGVSPASVSEMLKKLEAEGYVTRSSYRGSSLTAKGEQRAQRVTRKHRLLERFLADVLRIPLERVHEQACAMEHSLSDEAEEALCKILNHPDLCPEDGQVIPACDLLYLDCDTCMKGARKRGTPVGRRKEGLVPIASMRDGDSGRISFVRGDMRFVREVQSLGLAPGARVTLRRRAWQNGPAKVWAAGVQTTLAAGSAARIFVTLDRRGKR